MKLRNAQPTDFKIIVELNHAEVAQTSAMDLSRLELLAEMASYHKVAVVDDQVVGFLFAMKHTAVYENTNFEWFKSHHQEFVYIDRIVVNKKYAGMNIGTALYKDLIEYTRDQNIDFLTCEYYIKPLNRPSQKFHHGFGFEEVGKQYVADRSKLVSLQVLALD